MAERSLIGSYNQNKFQHSKLLPGLVTKATLEPTQNQETEGQNTLLQNNVAPSDAILNNEMLKSHSGRNVRV